MPVTRTNLRDVDLALRLLCGDLNDFKKQYMDERVDMVEEIMETLEESMKPEVRFESWSKRQEERTIMQGQLARFYNDLVALIRSIEPVTNGEADIATIDHERAQHLLQMYLNKLLSDFACFLIDRDVRGSLSLLEQLRELHLSRNYEALSVFTKLSVVSRGLAAYGLESVTMWNIFGEHPGELRK